MGMCLASPQSLGEGADTWTNSGSVGKKKGGNHQYMWSKDDNSSNCKLAQITPFMELQVKRKESHCFLNNHVL